MKRYSEYKDSGVKWLGEIPSHWEVIKTSRVFSYIGSGTTPKSGSEEYYTQNGVPFLQTGDLNDGYVADTSKRITEKALHDTNLKIYPKGSLIVAMYGATIGKLGILDIESTVNQACCVLTKSPIVETKFAFYFYLAAKRDLIFQSKGGGQPNISQDTIKSERIPVPHKEEQDAIVAYLDAATSKIDEAIAQQQKMIDLLNERKQIIINNAVTKGLDPNAPMKDSGVEWIGEIPEHWALIKLKYLGVIKSGDGIKNEELKEYGEYPVWGGNGLMGYTDKYNREKNAIIIGRVGALCGNVRYLKSPTFITDNALIFDITQQVNHIFLLYSMQAANLNVLNTSNAQPLITGTKVKNVFIPFPTIEEQTRIVSFIEKQCLTIDEAITNYQQQISLLQERKQIIINDVVTGKVKVV